MSIRHVCRFCANPLTHTFVDLGTSPLCQRHVTPDNFESAEPFYPLHVYVCEKCLLIQLPEYVSPKEIFTDYAYFSSFVDTLVNHGREYVEMIIPRLGLGPASRVVEIASNDGYLLQHFVKAGIPALGIEPAANVAEAALKKGIPTIVKFFGQETARQVASEYGQADLILGNSVLPHVPNINDFVAGIKLLLKPGGVITLEYQHLKNQMELNQFDTIYHEHFSYLSFLTSEKILAAQGLTIFHVEEVSTHGGSLRIFATHSQPGGPAISDRVIEMRDREVRAGFDRLDHYTTYGHRVAEVKWKLLEFLISAKRAGKRIAAYGAPGKSATLLNFCGIRTDFIDYTVDRSPHKQGNFLPGTRIPILHPDRIQETRPDYLLILPWNLKDEIMKQTSYLRQWGGKWVVPIPELAIVE